MNVNLRGFYKEAYFYSGLPNQHSFTPSGKVAGGIFAISTIKNSAVILHGSSGCGFHYRYLCRRSWNPTYDLQCTNIEEKDIIIGGELKLEKTILETVEKYNPSIIGIVPASSVDMIGDNIEGVIRRLQPKINCTLVFVKSKKISHADKRNIGRKTMCKKANEEINSGDGALKSCGFSEAMEAIVENVMKPQKINKNLVNICGFNWGIHQNAVVDGIKNELNKIGININTSIPNCKVEDLITAPRAALNLITSRVKWVIAMKERFGNDYLVVKDENYGYKGLDGIEKFYLDIVTELGYKKIFNDHFSIRKEIAKRKIDNVVAKLDKYSCVLYIEDFRNISKFLFFYKNVININVKYVVITLKKNRYMSMFSDKELYKMAVDNINEVYKRIEHKFEWMINPSEDELNKIYNEVDLNVGIPIDIKFEQNSKYLYLPKIIPMDFDNYADSISKYVSIIYKIISKNKRRILTLENINNNLEASKKMWDIVWLQRGVKQNEL